MLLERVVTHSPREHIPFNRNSNSSNPEDSENGLAPYMNPGKTGKRGGGKSFALASQTFIFKVA